MFAPERIRIIKGILLNKKHINVTDLSNMLNVSEVTIRRDLEKLEREKFLTRTHGGAIINDPAEVEEVLPASDDPWFEERLEVGEVAAHMVLDGDVILLCSGSTNFCVARKILSKKNLTVLTNDLNIASELSSNATIKVILPGGDLDPKNMTLSGKLTEENIRSFFVEKAFIEVEGVSSSRGYTVQSMEKASLIREMVRITKQTIVVCHHSAFDNIAFSQIGPLSMGNKVVSTPKVPESYKKFFFENNIQLFTSINAYEGEK